MAESLAAGEAIVELRAVGDKIQQDVRMALGDVRREVESFEKATAAKPLFGGALVAANQGLELLSKTIRGVSSVVTGLVVKTGEQAEAMLNASEATGLSTDQLQALKFAAESSDASFEAVQVGLKTLASAATDAATKGGDAAQKFTDLGVKVIDASGSMRPLNDILRDVADGISKLPPGAQRSAAAVDLLGRSGTQLIPVFANGAAGLDSFAAAAVRAGAVIGGDALRATAALDDQLDALKAQTDGVKAAIGVELVPAVSDAVKAISDWISKNGDLLKQDVAGLLSNLARLAAAAIPKLLDLADAIATAAGKWAKWAADMQAGSMADLAGRINDVKFAIAGLEDTIARKKSFGLATAEDEARLVGLKSTLESLRGEVVAVSKATDKAAESTDKQGEAAGRAGPKVKLTAAEMEKAAKAAETLAEKLDALDVKRLAENAKGAADLLKDASPENLVPAYVRAMDSITVQYDREIEAARRAATAVSTTAADEQRIEAEINGRRISDMVAVTGAFQDGAVKQTEALRKIADGWKELDATKIDDAIAELDRTFSDGAISSATAYAQSVELVGKKYEILQQVARDEAESTEAGDLRVAQLERERGLAVDELGRRYKGLAKIIDESITDAARSISRSLADLVVTDTFKGNFDDIGREAGSILVGGIADVVKDTLADVLFSPVRTALSAVLSGAFSGLTGIVSEGLGGVLSGGVISGIGGFIGEGLGAVSPGVLDAFGALGTGAGTSFIGSAGAAITGGLGLLAAGGALAAGVAFGIPKLLGWDKPDSAEKFRADVVRAVTVAFNNPAVLAAFEEAGRKTGKVIDEGMLGVLTDPTQRTKAIGKAFASIGDAWNSATKGVPSDQFVKALLPTESAMTQSIDRELAAAIANATVDTSQIKDKGKATVVINDATNAILAQAVALGYSGEQLTVYLRTLADGVGAADNLARALGDINAVIDSNTYGDVFMEKFRARLEQMTGQTIPKGIVTLEQLATWANTAGVDAAAYGAALDEALKDAPPALQRVLEPLKEQRAALLDVTGAAKAMGAALGVGLDSAMANVGKFGLGGDLGTRISGQIADAILTAKNAILTDGKITDEEAAQFFAPLAKLDPETIKQLSPDALSGLRNAFLDLEATSGKSLQEIVDGISPPLPQAARDAVNSIMRVGSAFDSIANAGQASVDQAVAAFQNLKKSGRDTEKNIEQINSNIAAGFQNTYQGMVQDGKIGVNELAALFREYNTAQAALGDDLSQETKDSFQGILDQLEAVTGLGGDQLRQLADDFASGRVDAAGLAAEIATMGGNVEGAAAAADVLSAAVDETQQSLDSVDPTPITEFIRILKEQGPDAFLSTTTAVNDALAPAMQALVDSMLPIGADIVPSVGDLSAAVTKAGNEAIKPQASDWKGAFGDVTGSVGDLIQRIAEIPRNISIDVEFTGPGAEKMHSGGIVPGTPGQEVPTILEAGEIVIPRGIARMGFLAGGLGGANVGALGSIDRGYAAVRISTEDLEEGAVFRLVDLAKTGRVRTTKHGRIKVHPSVGARR